MVAPLRGFARDGEDRTGVAKQGEPETDEGPVDLRPGERVRQGRRTLDFRA